MGQNSWNGRETDHLLLSRGDGRFVECATTLGFRDPRDGRGLAAADFDHDGDIDFVINNYNANASYWVNELPQRKGYVALRAPVGTRLLGANQRRDVRAGSGYASQQSAEQLFFTDTPLSVEVRWPSGQEERLGPFALGSRHTLRPSIAAPPPPSAASPAQKNSHPSWLGIGTLLLMGIGLVLLWWRARA